MSTTHISIRLDDETMTRVDALSAQFSTEWRPATRSDILRALIQTALEMYERKEAQPPRPRGSQAPHRRKRTPKPSR